MLTKKTKYFIFERNIKGKLKLSRLSMYSGYDSMEDAEKAIEKSILDYTNEYGYIQQAEESISGTATYEAEYFILPQITMKWEYKVEKKKKTK